MKLRYYLRGLAVGIIVTTLVLTIANAGNHSLSNAEIRRRALELGMVDGETIKLSAGQNKSDGRAEDESGPAEGSGAAGMEPGAGTDAENGQPEDERDAVGAGTDAESGRSENESGNAPEGSVAAGIEPGAGADERNGQPETGGTETEKDGAQAGADERNGQPETESSEAPAGTDVGRDTEAVTIEIRNGATSYTVSKELAAAGLIEDAAAFDAYLCDNGYARTVRTGIYKILPGTSEEEIARIIAR